MYRNIIKKQSFIIIMSVAVMSVILIGTSYALFSQTNTSTSNQVVTSGTLVINYSGTDSNAIYSGEGGIIPEDPENGFTIKITNTGTLGMDYNILLYTTTGNEVDHSIIKVQLDDGEIKTLSNCTKTPDTASNTNKNEIKYIIGSSSVEAANPTNSDEKTHVVKVWLDSEDESIIGQTMIVKAKVEGIVAGSED